MALSISNLIGAGAKAGMTVINPGLMPVANWFGAFGSKNKQPATTTPTKTNTPFYPTPTGAPVKPLVNTPTAQTQTGYQQPLQTTPTTTTAQITQTQPRQTQTNTTSFPDVIRGLVNPSQKEPNKYLTSVAKSAQQSPVIAKQAQDISKKYADEINRVGQLGAGAVAGHLSTGTNVVGSGNAAIASQSASQRMNALTQGLGAELSGVEKQLTGQEQQTQGLSTSLQGSLTQQQQQLQALQNAGGLIQPGVAGYGQTVFDPLTGTYKNAGGGLEPTAVASQLAQDVLAGRKTYEQAVQSLGYAGNAGQQFLNNALQQASGGGFNAPLSSAQIGGQADIIGSLPLLKSSETAAQGIKDQIVTLLASNPDLNPTALVKANFIDQWVQGELSNPKYQSLYNLLNEYTNTLTPILGVGGSTTNLKTEIAQSFINAASSGQSISQVLEGIQNMSRAKIQNIESGALGGGTVSSPYITGGGGTGSGGLYDF